MVTNNGNTQDRGGGVQVTGNEQVPPGSMGVGPRVGGGITKSKQAMMMEDINFTHRKDNAHTQNKIY